MTKPLIKKELEDSDISLELTQENEEGNEEDEMEVKEDVLDVNLYSIYLIDDLCIITNRSYNCFISQYENNFIPRISTPPPQCV